jgi:hypothetical protein
MALAAVLDSTGLDPERDCMKLATVVPFPQVSNLFPSLLDWRSVPSLDAETSQELPGWSLSCTVLLSPVHRLDWSPRHAQS